MSEWSAWEPSTRFVFEHVIYEKRRNEEYGAYVARITINRPDRLNALTDAGFKEIYRALDDASHDDDVGVVVLTSVGDRAFCAGGDVQAEAQGLARKYYYDEYPPNQFLRSCRKPIIAAVKGYAIGGGNHIAYFCDFTIAAENAIFGQNGPRVGSPADGYLVSYLTRVIGAKRAREMWMLCRKYNARQALEWGLVNAVVPLDQLDAEVEKWCLEILEKSPTCIQSLKASFDADIDYLVASAGKITALMNPHFFESEEQKEGPRAFFEKRKPNFWKARKVKS